LLQSEKGIGSTEVAGRNSLPHQIDGSPGGFSLDRLC
jgi:hypothetical protein